MTRKQLAQDALLKALQIRRKLYQKSYYPICIFDLASNYGINIQFAKLPSVEGMYSKHPAPTIILGSERPSGRQVFNCAHEFGHHIFEHGVRIDQLINTNMSQRTYQPEEFLVDCFAGFLLMPQVAVEQAFNERSWNIKNATPIQMYTIANYFGVGYSALITHMTWSLKLLGNTAAKHLLKQQPKSIRKEILGQDFDSDVVIVDCHWKGRPIDVCVGDIIVAPPGTEFESNYIGRIKNYPNGSIFQGLTPGVGRLYNDHYGWASYVRISRKEYVGLYQYRHLEDPCDE